MTAGAGNAVHLEGPVTVETVPGLVEQIRQQLKLGATQVDFSHVTEIDSAAVALALEWHRQAAAENVPLALVNVPETMRNLANLYGVADFLTAPKP
jgi:phospholipid transport system transporter-binding protein